MKRPERYIIDNSYVRRKYLARALWALLLSIVALFFEKLGIHVWLAKQMIDSFDGIKNAKNVMGMIARTGLRTCQGVMVAGIVIMVACLTPLAISCIAQAYVNAKKEEVP